MKIKLIYKDDIDKYFIRFANGKSKIVKLNEAYHLAEENKISIGDSEYNESKNIKLDWTDGTPIPIPIKLKGYITKENYHREYMREYYKRNKAQMITYSKERYARKKRLDKTLVNE
jgi:hypothetical protein